MIISEYRVTIQSKEHGKIVYKTVDTSAKGARKRVIDAEGCPPSCVKQTKRTKIIHQSETKK